MSTREEWRIIWRSNGKEMVDPTPFESLEAAQEITRQSYVTLSPVRIERRTVTTSEWERVP